MMKMVSIDDSAKCFKDKQKHSKIKMQIPRFERAISSALQMQIVQSNGLTKAPNGLLKFSMKFHYCDGWENFA